MTACHSRKRSSHRSHVASPCDLRTPSFAEALATPRPMTDLELSRALRTLRRTVQMLETELRHGRLDEALITEIDAQMERGIASEPRCAQLVKRVDDLRESTLTPRTELLGDTIRACEKLRDGIDEVVGRL